VTTWINSILFVYQEAQVNERMQRNGIQTGFLMRFFFFDGKTVLFFGGDRQIDRRSLIFQTLTK